MYKKKYIYGVDFYDVPWLWTLSPLLLFRPSSFYQTEIFDAVERVQVEDGWVSMRLREDRGSGAPLLMALN